jgi:hypothetical protein
MGTFFVFMVGGSGDNLDITLKICSPASMKTTSIAFMSVELTAADTKDFWLKSITSILAN